MKNIHILLLLFFVVIFSSCESEEEKFYRFIMSSEIETGKTNYTSDGKIKLENKFGSPLDSTILYDDSKVLIGVEYRYMVGKNVKEEKDEYVKEGYWNGLKNDIYLNVKIKYPENVISNNLELGIEKCISESSRKNLENLLTKNKWVNYIDKKEIWGEYTFNVDHTYTFSGRVNPHNGTWKILCSNDILLSSSTFIDKTSIQVTMTDSGLENGATLYVRK